MLERHYIVCFFSLPSYLHNVIGSLPPHLVLCWSVLRWWWLHITHYEATATLKHLKYTRLWGVYVPVVRTPIRNAALSLSFGFLFRWTACAKRRMLTSQDLPTLSMEQHLLDFSQLRETSISVHMYLQSVSAMSFSVFSCITSRLLLLLLLLLVDFLHKMLWAS